jgi:SAM-dependent methyltransferase
MAKPNLYVFDDPATEQSRLLLQAQLFSDYIETHAADFLPIPPKRILDLGCGGGHFAATFHRLYPQAELIGIDRDQRALEIARAQPRLGPKVQFVEGDIQQALPPGPFDLIYASMALSHMRDLAHVVGLIYNALAPGGTLWVKDLHPQYLEGFTHPECQELNRLMFTAVQRVGGHPYVSVELPDLLTAAGFTDLRGEPEFHPLGGETLEGEIGMADLIAVYRNSRRMVSGVMGVPEQEILGKCAQLTAEAQAGPVSFGEGRFINLLAHRPADA